MGEDDDNGRQYREPAPAPLWRRASLDRTRDTRRHEQPREVEDEWPETVRFVGDDGPAYIVLDLQDGYERRVPKRRLAPEVFPATRKRPLRGSRLLRLSTFALAGALLGGVVGLALGSIVLIVALARLAAFEQRTRAWRRRQAQRGAPEAQRQQRMPLPVAATSERLRLLTAMGQSLVAIALAVLELALVALLR